jgi:hypothetical protein
VLASLGVKVAGQQEQDAGTEEKEAIAEAAGEEPANEDPNIASLATMNRMGAASPQGTSAGAAFSSQRPSIAGQAEIELIKSQTGVPNLIALSNAPASSLGEAAAKSTVRSSQSPAESEEVKHPAHTEKGKWPQETSIQSAPQLTTMPAQWVPTPVVVPISKNFETTAPVRNPTVSDMIATNGVENNLEAAPTPTHQVAVTGNRSAQRGAVSGPGTQQAPQRSNVTPLGANETAADEQEPGLPGTTKTPTQLPALEAGQAPGSAVHASQIENRGLSPDSGTVANPTNNKEADASGSVGGTQSVPADPTAVKTALGPTAPTATQASIATKASVRSANLLAAGGSGGIGNHLIHPQSVLSAPEPVGQNTAWAGGSAENAPVSSATGGSAVAASSSRTQAGETFSALDVDVVPSAPTWTHAGGQRAEAGFQDPSLGWVTVRAEMSGGGIHASLVPGTAEAAQTLGGHIPGLSGYLAEHHTPVETLTLAAPGSRSSDAGMDSSRNQNMQQGTGYGAGQGAGQGAGPDTGQGSPRFSEINAGTAVSGIATGSSLSQTGSAGTAAPHSVTSGLHISVMA